MVSSQAPIPSIEASLTNKDVAVALTHGDKNGEGSFELPMTLAQAIKMGEQLLVGIGIDAAHLEAQILCGHVLGLSRLELILSPDILLSLSDVKRYFALVGRRLYFEPIAYIVGTKEFYGRNFLVTEHCLIPRPDTECVLEAALRWIFDGPSEGMMLDLCTGSGAIGLSALAETKNLQLIATDISEEALCLAAANAARLGVHTRVRFLKSDLFNELSPRGIFDLIVSNPPYIAPDEISTLARDVKDFEPHIALFSPDPQGLYFYQRILSEAAPYLRPGGFLVLEMGFGQRQGIEKLLNKDFAIIEVFRDLGGIERGIVLRKL